MLVSYSECENISERFSSMHYIKYSFYSKLAL